MKKTNEKLVYFKRFIPSLSWRSLVKRKFYGGRLQSDLKNIIDLYHEYGYRMAEILKDTILPIQ